ncbi:MAG: methyl-accepting chemotaxis protein [Deltaproteobacteria bacterium]|nr:methyl-accepting chemotaxis protein [Deltaproteobacteria bacterium]
MFQRIRDQKIGVKVSLAFSSILFLLGVIVLTVFFLTNQVQKKTNEMREKSFVYSKLALQMKMDVIQVQQWLTDISATRSQNGLDDGFKKADESANHFLASLAKFRSYYQHENPENLPIVDELESRFHPYYETGKRMAQAYIQGGAPAGNRMMGAFDKEAERLSESLEKFVDHETEDLEEHVGHVAGSINLLKVVIVSSGALSMLLGIFLTILITRSLTKPLHQVVAQLEEMSKGHIDGRLVVTSHDEIGHMIESIDHFAEDLQTGTVNSLKMLASGDLTFESIPKDEKDVIGIALKLVGENLNRLISDIRVGSEYIATSSNQVANAASSVSQGAVEQSAALEEISSSLSELTGKTRINAESASKANGLMQESKKLADTGRSQINQMMNVMAKINSSGEEVAKVIKLIDEIAFQTNLLALNAAVEAARVGKYGTGFAVVASEVHSLSEKAAAAARESAELIEKSSTFIHEGMESASQTSFSFEQIHNSVDTVSRLVGEIARSSNDQALAIYQVTETVTQIHKIVEQNSANSEESASASEELATQARQMKDMVSRFKVKDHPAPTAVIRMKPRPGAKDWVHHAEDDKKSEEKKK